MSGPENDNNYYVEILNLRNKISELTNQDPSTVSLQRFGTETDTYKLLRMQVEIDRLRATLEDIANWADAEGSTCLCWIMGVDSTSRCPMCTAASLRAK